MQAGAASKHNNQHKNTPEYAKRRQEGPQSVLFQSAQYFLPVVSVKNHISVFVRLSALSYIL
jgi:hypothetical protein